MVTVGSILSGTFRFIGNNVRAILVWSAILFLLTLVMMAMMRPIYEAQIATLQQAGTTPVPPPIGSFLLFVPVGLVAFVMLAAAAFRAVLFPEQSRFAYLRLGMDELRLLGTALVLIIGFYIAMIVTGIAAGLVVAVVAAALGGSAVTGALLVGLPMIAFSTWLMVRFALAAPLTILQRKVVIGPAWRLSRGHFWSLLGAYIVVLLLVFVIYAVVLMIRMGPVMTDLLHPTDQAAALRVASAQIEGFTLSLKNIVITAISSVVFGFAHALYAGGIAVAAAQLSGGGGERRLNEVFE
jgi:hypothetical protein